MLPKNNRFTRRQFAAARKRMKSFRAGPFLFLYRTDERNPSRFATVVKKKTDKRATARNKFKRQVYTHLRDSLLPRFDHLQLICLHQGSTFDSTTIPDALKAFATHYQK